MTRKRRRLLSWLAGSLAFLSFLVLSSYAVVWANGLRFNPASGSFEKTVLVAIDSNRADVAIIINGTKVADQIPYRGRNLLPSTYVIELAKSGFQTWRQTFYLSEGQVGLIEDPVMIAESPLTTNSPSGLTPKLVSSLDFGLTLVNGELSDGGTLVTRFSKLPSQIHRYNSFYLYQTDGQLRLFIPAGTQDYLIYNGTQLTQMPLALFTNTWQVGVTDNDSVKLVNLTIPTVTAP